MKRQRNVQVVKIEVKIGDKTVSMDRDEVIRKLRGLNLGTVRHHSVKVEDVDHPIKKAFAHVTGVDVLDFNTITARNAFKKLGFEVDRS